MIPDPRERPTITVEEAGRLCGISRAVAYDEARRFLATDGAEGLPVIKFARRLVVPTSMLLAKLGFADSAVQREDDRWAEIIQMSAAASSRST